MMFWDGNNMNGWGYAGMGIGMVLFWALIIVGIVALVRFSSGTQQGGQSNNDAPSPEQMLAGRFARGDIDQTQYRERLAVLPRPRPAVEADRHEGTGNMNAHRPKQHVVVNNGPDGDPVPKATGGHSRHRWMMLACTAPLLLIATALILTGSVGIGSAALIVGCVAMMSAMMFAMARDRR